MARKAGLVAVLAGTADIIPLGRIVSRVGRVQGMRITGKLFNVLNEAAEQGLKSGGQQTTNNLIAQHYYDANRGLFDEVIEASGGSLTPALVISLLKMTAARGWHVREGQLRKKWQRAAPAESGTVSREASPGAAPETESKARFAEREHYFDEDPESLEFVRSRYDDDGPQTKAAVKRVDAIWGEFQKEMEKLGFKVDYSRPHQRSECDVDGEGLVFYLGFDKLVDYETKAPRKNVALGKATRLTLGEELIHAAHLKKFKEEWVAANRPGDLQSYVADRQREAFADMRKTIEGASGKDREVMLRTIKQSYDVYFRNFEEDIPANPSEKDILAFIEKKGDSPTFMNEFMRQIVQLSEQGEITEDARSNFVRASLDWVKQWLAALRKSLPIAFSGDLGPELRTQIEQIQKSLDQIDRNVFRG